MDYRVRTTFKADVGFKLNASQVRNAADLTNKVLASLPASLYRSLDFKTSSAIVGSVFCDALAAETGAIVNPIEKGHPDLVPAKAATASEAELRNYASGLEVKSTIGNIEQGANLRAGQTRVSRMTAITWQAHHRDVEQLMGLTWDFAQAGDPFHPPGITGVFHSQVLVRADWGEISGTTGRNTKVSAMRRSGKEKMAKGWVLLIDHDEYLKMFQKVLGIVVPAPPSLSGSSVKKPS